MFGLWHMGTACVCYCRYMKPLQFLLEETRVFPVGWTEKKENKIPLQPKLMLLILKTLYHNQPYTTNISHLISMTVSSHSTSTHSHFACPLTHTPTHTPDSVPNHKFQLKTKNKLGELESALTVCPNDLIEVRCL